MTVEAYSFGNSEGRRLPYVVQKYAPGKRARRLLHAIEHQENMLPHIPLRMKLRRLLHALTSFQLRQNVGEKSRTVQQLKAVPRASFGENTDQFLSNAFRRNMNDLGSETLHASHCFLVY